MAKVKCSKKLYEEFIIYPVKLRIARAIKGWSISELAEVSGVHRKTIARIENSNSDGGRINKATFDKLVSVLDMDMEFYFTEELTQN